MSKAVIDQPGIRVLFFGLLVSFILGFSFRTQISSSRVEKALEKAKGALENDFAIDFQNAEIRLAKWGFPWPHLIIEKIRISPQKKQCQGSQIYIDELELPLSLKQIFSRKQVIQFIRAQNVEIRINEIDPCFNSLSKKNNSHLENEKIVQNQLVSILAQSNDKTLSSASTLNEVVIEQLKIISMKNIEQPVVLKQLKFLLKYDLNKLSHIDFRSRLYTFKDLRTNIYFLNADLNAEIKPDRDHHIEATLQLKGKLLDGDVQIFSKVSSLNQKISYEMSLKQVSLKAFSPLLLQTKNETSWDHWPLAVSFYMIGETKKDSEIKTYLKFKDISILGDSTLIETSGLDLEILNSQALIKPFQMNLNQVDLTPLKNIFSEKFDVQSFENLGLVSGQFKYEDATHWSFDGPIEKTNLIFSNRGTRELQSIDSVKMSVDRKNQLVNLKLNDFVLNSEEIKGALEAQYINDQKSIQIKLNLEGVLLSEKIWKQLTLIRQAPMVKLNWQYKKAQEERHQVKLSLAELRFQGLQLNDVQIDFLQLKENQTKTMGLNLKSSKLAIHIPEISQRLTEALFNSQTGLLANDYIALKTQLNLQGSDWKNMTFDLESSLHESEEKPIIEQIKSKGEWKSDNSLTGLVSIQNSKRLQKLNLIKNIKDEVVIVPISESQE